MQQQSKMRISIIVSIIVTCSLSFLMAAGVGWLSLYKQAETIKAVTSLYENAFEGVNYTYRAYGEFERLMRFHPGEETSFADEESKSSIAAIKEDLSLANDLATGDREISLIAEITENLDALASGRDTVKVAARIDGGLTRLVRRFTADRLDSAGNAADTIAQSRSVIKGCLGLTLILGIVVAAVMVVAILPQIRHGLAIAEAIAAGKLDNKIVVKGMKETAQLLGALSIMQDSISDNVANLQAARQRAIKSENAKSEFLANMSHELRTPLNNIIGSIQLLQDRPLPEKDRELFSLVERSSKSLLGIVNDILDLSKIEAGEVKLEHIGFDAFEKIRDVTKLFMAQAGKKNISMSSVLDGERLYVLGDPLRFERILTNLAGNALRYTERGSICIKAVCRKEGAGQVRLRCEVIDTGIGIPKDRQGKIFERFSQADNSTSRRFGGTGLGLTITRELISLMKGEIGLESEVGKGSTFWFEIPFEETTLIDSRQDSAIQALPQVHEGAIPAREARILIAEDHELNRAFMRRLFENLGITGFTFAENGREAVEKVQGGKFDLVLMDCHMPELDGYAATAAIRGLPEPSRRGVPIVAMTANAMASEEERCLKAGMNAYISKPFEFSTFKRILSPWVNFEEKAENPAKKVNDGPAPADLEILLASGKGDSVYINEMIGLFISTAEQNLRELKELAGGDGNQKAWIEAAHSLKGAAGIIGAGRLGQLAAQAQIMEEGSAEERLEMVKAIDEEYMKLRGFLSDRQLA